MEFTRTFSYILSAVDTYFVQCCTGLSDSINIIIYQDFKEWLEQNNNTEDFVSCIDGLINKITHEKYSDKFIDISNNLKFKILDKSCGKTIYVLTIEYDYI